MGGQLALLLLDPGDEVQQQNAHLVAGHQLELAALLYGDAHPVAVRVGGQQQVRLDLLAQLQAFLQSLPELGVGIGVGGEVSVGILLLRHHGHILNADAL